jgi:hypothetical protein
VYLIAPRPRLATVIRPLFPTHHATVRWRRVGWSALPPREQQRLLLLLETRETHSAPGGVRNHWRRKRLEAVRLFTSLGSTVPVAFTSRHLNALGVRKARKDFAQSSIAARPPNKSFERTREG